MGMSLHPSRLLVVIVTLAVTGFFECADVAAQNTTSPANGTFETVATLPSADTENLFITPDGAIYVTSMDAKTVFKVTPDGHVSPFATIPTAAFVLGVSSTGDGFALTVATRPFRRPGAAGQPPQIDFSDAQPEIVLLDKSGKITATIPGPKGSFFNGIAAESRPGMYMVSDSGTGIIWQVDARKKRLDSWFKDDALAPNESVRIGANGIKVHDGSLYVSARGGLYRVKIGSDGRPAGALTTIAQGIRTDDFDVAKDGTIYLTSMMKVSPAGEVSQFLDKVPTGPAVFVSRDGKWLYWSTRGSDPQQRLLRAPIR